MIGEMPGRVVKRRASDVDVNLSADADVDGHVDLYVYVRVCVYSYDRFLRVLDEITTLTAPPS
jgi:hypothetical protein